MSQNFTSSSYSYSSSQSNVDGQVSGFRSSEQTTTGPSGTTVTSTSQNLGEAANEQVRHFDTQGRELADAPGQASNNRIEDVTDAEQAERDREYEERIEEEYAKREGGA